MWILPTKRSTNDIGMNCPMRRKSGMADGKKACCKSGGGGLPGDETKTGGQKVPGGIG